MATDVHNKAKQYSRRKYTLALVDIAYSLLVFIVFIFSGASHALADYAYAVSTNYYGAIALYVCIAAVLYAFVSLPLSFYQSFALEHAFGLSTQSFRQWLADYLKSFAVGFVIVLILIEAFYVILALFPALWWIVVSIFWIFFSVILAKVTPTLLIPLFFKYKPLADEALKGRIVKLAENMGIGPARLDVFEIDFSKKTVKANAAFVGVGSTKRVLLADTLKDKYTHDEIEVILAHEFAHYRFKHLLKLVGINSFFTFVLLYLLYVSSGAVLAALKLGPLNDVSVLPVVFLYMAVFNTLAQPLANYISRVFERQADRRALECTRNTPAFISVMTKLGEQNLADTAPAQWAKIFFFDHPPISERIAMAESFKDEA